MYNRAKVLKLWQNRFNADSNFFHICSVWVLCINNEFRGYERILKHRRGSEQDVTNLHKTLTKRGCIFKDLSCKNRNEILDVFRSEENFLKFFNPPGNIFLIAFPNSAKNEQYKNIDVSILGRAQLFGARANQNVALVLAF